MEIGTVTVTAKLTGDRLRRQVYVLQVCKMNNCGYNCLLNPGSTNYRCVTQETHDNAHH
jgi:hypothetical protein